MDSGEAFADNPAGCLFRETLPMRWFMVKLLVPLTAALFPICASGLDLAVLGSYWDPDDADAAWGMGGKAGIPLLTEHLDLQARAYWYPDVSAGKSGRIDFVPVDLGAAVQFLPGADLNPSLAAGVSYVFVDSGGRDRVDGNWGAYAGAGLEIGLAAGFVIDAELLFRFAELDYADSFKDEAFRVNGLTANLGLGFRF